MRKFKSVGLAASTMLSVCACTPSLEAAQTPGSPAASASPAVIKNTEASPEPFPVKPESSPFYAMLRPDARLAMPQRNLATLRTESTVVVLAKVVQVRDGEGEVPGPDDPGLQNMNIVIDIAPVRVISGALTKDAGPTISVPILSTTTDKQATIRELQENLPDQPSVWFLRWAGQPLPFTKTPAPTVEPLTDPNLYALTHVFGLFTQGPSGVTVALANAEDPVVGFMAEAASLDRLDEISERIPE